MILKVVKYGHPALRKKGARVETITPEIHELIANMFETMHASRGIGLAAQQVAEPVQLTVIDVREVSDERPSTLELNGKPADVANSSAMEVVTIGTWQALARILANNDFPRPGSECSTAPRLRSVQEILEAR